jgi:AraC-like DNA-binding protein
MSDATSIDLVVTANPSDLVGPRSVWYARRQFAAWSWAKDLVGWVLWGHFADDDAEEGKRLWVAQSRRVAMPYDFVLDLRRLESVSRGAFERIREFAHTAKPGLRKMAVLVGDAASGGAIQVGLFALRPPAYGWEAFTDWRDAARWLERAEASAILGAAERRAGQDTRRSPLHEIRRLLEERPRATVADAARSLSRSKRALQRWLNDNGTTFLDERDRARVARAQDMLLEPAMKLDAIAAAIGCTDRRSLNRLFRRVTGESPAEFRARRGLLRA